MTVVGVGGRDEERVERAVAAFEAEGFSRVATLVEATATGNFVVPLRDPAADVLDEADRLRLEYVLVHHGPDNGVSGGTYSRGRHRVEAPQLAELARRLRDDERMLVTCLAFAYQKGIPDGSAWVVDARCLDNPYWVDELRSLDGRDPRVSKFVLRQPEASSILGGLEAMLRLVLPAYWHRGRMDVKIAFGCTGGRQRSVALALDLARRLRRNRDLEVRAQLRDL